MIVKTFFGQIYFGDKNLSMPFDQINPGPTQDEGIVSVGRQGERQESASAKKEIYGEQKPFRVVAEEKCRHNQDDLEEVDDQYRLWVKQVDGLLFLPVRKKQSNYQKQISQ